ncbi:MAG: acyl-CoA thioesterase/BAAT N-terminal domain-containing protein, partial [Holophagales bacterium]|nr:acyl-CoA thioesterase/BAAT N-terminal domain-containing protein [Holophagales bacterium]
MAQKETPSIIKLSKDSAVVDERIDIRLSGLKPNAEVTLRVSMIDDLGREWFVDALYLTDDSGAVDVSKQRPANRVYAGDDYMCLFSVADLDIDSAMKGPPVFMKNVEEPVETRFIVTMEGTEVASASMQRYFADPGVRIQRFSEEGLIGTLFLPSEKGSHPAVLVIGGAIGGPLWSERYAAVLASHGFAALSLIYFGRRHLAPELVEIPIEYFTAAASRLLDHSETNNDSIAIVGSSKGSEAALLTAAHFEQTTSVVCYVPPAVVYQGIQVDGPILTARSSWTWRGRTLPFVPCYQEGSRFGMNTLMHLHELHSANLDSSYIVDRATIPTEKIAAPLMMISAEEDRIWPSPRMAEMILHRRMNLGQNLRTRHVSYAGAGHGLSVPFMPQYAFGGGTSRDNAAAESEAWAQALGFLKGNSR